MAQIDARIPLMAQPVQIESPIAQMNALANLKNAMQLNKLREVQMRQAEAEMANAPQLAQMNFLVKMADVQKKIREAQDAETRSAAMREAQELMRTGGYQPTAEYPDQPQVMLNEQAALEEARRQQAAGQPVRIAVPNQGKLQALLMQANPQQATSELLKQMNPAAQRGVVVPAGGAYIPPGQTAPSYKADFAPRAEPAPVVRPVPSSGSPTGYSYEDMRRPGVPLSPAPQPPSEAIRAEKKIDEARAAQARVESVRQKAGVVLSKADEALSNIGFFTTGVPGSLTGVVPGTPAFDLQNTLDTIKANLGFQELAEMRRQSPTGGALGQVAVKELDFLQNAVASLNRGQSQSQLRKNIESIRRHIQNWREAVEKASAEEMRGGINPQNVINPSILDQADAILNRGR